MLHAQTRSQDGAAGALMGELGPPGSASIRQEFLESALTDAAQRYLEQGNRFVHLACTGAGAGLQQALWRVPGASAMLAGAVFPYAKGAPERFVQQPIVKSVSMEAALQLASASFLEAQQAQIESADGKAPRECVGLGMTAAVVTNRIRRGNDEIHIALCSERGTRTVHVEISKGISTRSGIDLTATLLAMNLLLEEANLEQIPVPAEGDMKSPHLAPHDRGLQIRSAVHSVAEALKLWDGTSLHIAADGSPSPAAEFTRKPHVLIPASINPFHWGHDGIALGVRERSGLPVAFELSLDNIDKREISIEEALRRTQLLRGRWPVLLSRGAPLLIDKFRRYGSSFGMGTDTALRVLSSEPRYCRDLTPEGVLAEIQRGGGRLYVASRGNATGATEIVAMVPTDLRSVFEPFPLDCRVSSTALKAAKAAGN